MLLLLSLALKGAFIVAQTPPPQTGHAKNIDHAHRIEVKDESKDKLRKKILREDEEILCIIKIISETLQI
jgi:hypothetical protein